MRKLSQPVVTSIGYSPEGPLLRAHLEPFRAWLEAVVGCAWEAALTLESELPWEALSLLPALLPGVPLAERQKLAPVQPTNQPLRWEVAPGSGLRLTARPSRPHGNDGALWTIDWQDTPIALWWEGMAHGVVAVNIPFISMESSRGPEQRRRPTLVVHPADAPALLHRLGTLLASRPRKVEVIGGRDLPLPGDGYDWDRVVLSPALVQLVRSDFESFLTREAWFRSQRLPYRRGYLLYGPPGNGKTSVIRVMACHPSITPLTIDLGNTMMENDDLSRLFERAAEQAPSLVIFEDVDRFFIEAEPGKERHTVTLQHFLNCLDGLGSGDGVIVVATANHPSRLDPAILQRPGRFDRVVEFGPPGEAERAAYFRHMGQGRFGEAETARVAQGAEGLSFAQLREAYVAAGQAAFARGGEITFPDLEAGLAVVRGLLGGLRQYRTQRPVGFETTARR